MRRAVGAEELLLSALRRGGPVRLPGRGLCLHLETGPSGRWACVMTDGGRAAAEGLGRPIPGDPAGEERAELHADVLRLMVRHAEAGGPDAAELLLLSFAEGRRDSARRCIEVLRFRSAAHQDGE